MKIRGVAVEEQIQWVLLYIQEESADIQKENILKDLERELLEYETAGEFLTDIIKEFGGDDEEMVKVAELKRVEQREKTIEEFVQEFRKIAKGSGYEGRPLVEIFKKEMNRIIYQKLMKSEWQPTLIKQWYNRVIALDRNWKESMQEEERLKEQQDNGAQAPRLNNQRMQQQQWPQPQV